MSSLLNVLANFDANFSSDRFIPFLVDLAAHVMTRNI